MLLATLMLLVAAVGLGGSSRSHALRVALVELSALPVLGLALLRILDQERIAAHRTALVLMAAIAAVPALQLMPLPAPVWSALPGREAGALALELGGLPLGWATASLAPDITLRNLWALLPALAIALAVLVLPVDERRRVVMTVILLTLACVALAAMQVLAGDTFYPWAHTTRGTVTGFLANRNHLATLCLMALPFCSAFGGKAARSGGKGMFASAVVVGVLVVAIALTRSRAGVSLLGPALIGCAAIAWVAAGRGPPRPALLTIGAGIGVALTLVLSVGLGPILARFDQDLSDEARFQRWPLVAEAAQAYLPTGAGIGTFDRVYRAVEPVSEVDETYFNQAHNDYLETWVEGGWLSIGVLLALLVWFTRRSIAAWAAPPGREADLQRAASVAIGVVLVHSAVDYPLRTLTILCVTALCAALLEASPEPFHRRGRAPQAR